MAEAKAYKMIPKCTQDTITYEMNELVRCKDCDNKECWGRAGDVVCGIDGTPHRPDWFCADGEREEGC